MSTARSILSIGVIAVVASLAGCGVGEGQPEGDLTYDTGIASQAPYLVLDCDSGQAETRLAIPDLESNPEYRDRLMVFRFLPDGTFIMGSTINQLGRKEELVQARSSSQGQQDGIRVGHFYMGVSEVTQGQWRRLAASTAVVQQPWSTVPRSLLGLTGPAEQDAAGLPAYALSPNQVAAVVAAKQAGGVKLAVPTTVEWEYACRSGGQGLFSWGSDFDKEPVKYAVARPATGVGFQYRDLPGTDTAQPKEVMVTRVANAFGLFDMHGNVWEITATQVRDTDQVEIRGGSWNDPIITARSSNFAAIPRSVGHPLVGVRLAMHP